MSRRVVKWLAGPLVLSGVLALVGCSQQGDEQLAPVDAEAEKKFDEDYQKQMEAAMKGGAVPGDTGAPAAGAPAATDPAAPAGTDPAAPAPTEPPAASPNP